MRFETWAPVYSRILEEFGYDRSADERARDVLGDLTTSFDQGKLRFLDGATVAVCGGAPSLADQLDIARRADIVVAASVAADVCRENGVTVDLMVTDLDKNPDTARTLTRAGTPVAVHAHGDNVPAIRREIPRFEPAWTVPTAQAEPAGPVENFGGFTDGDRAAFLADHFGADELLFPGWEFDDSSVNPEKAQKLAWAERLLYWLERRRGEQFTVLDGRRDGIDASSLPI